MYFDDFAESRVIMADSGDGPRGESRNPPLHTRFTSPICVDNNDNVMILKNFRYEVRQ